MLPKVSHRLFFPIPMASVSSASEAPSNPLRAKTAIASSSARSGSNCLQGPGLMSKTPYPLKPIGQYFCFILWSSIPCPSRSPTARSFFLGPGALLRHSGFPIHTMMNIARFVCLSLCGIPLSAIGDVDLPRATPESQGVSSASLLCLVDELEAKVDGIHSLMVVRRVVLVQDILIAKACARHQKHDCLPKLNEARSIPYLTRSCDTHR